MGGQHLKLLHIKEKKSWCDPILCHKKGYTRSQRQKNRYVQIIYQSSLVGNMFTRDSRKFINTIKELTLGTDSETRIKGLKCGRKAMQELQYHNDGTS